MQFMCVWIEKNHCQRRSRIKNTSLCVLNKKPRPIDFFFTAKEKGVDREGVREGVRTEGAFMMHDRKKRTPIGTAVSSFFLSALFAASAAVFLSVVSSLSVNAGVFYVSVLYLRRVSFVDVG